MPDPDTGFGEWVDRYKKRVFYLALDLCGNLQDAEDLTQETFLKAYQARRRFRGEAKATTWLYRIAVNTHLDMKKKANSQKRHHHEIDVASLGEGQVPRQDHPEHNPGRRLANVELQRHIQQALDRLSPLNRSVFVLRHYQGLKLAEIAAVLGRTEGTVKTSLHRAIRQLQTILQPMRERTYGSGHDLMPGISEPVS